MDMIRAFNFMDEAARYATEPGFTEDELVTHAIAYANSTDVENLAPLVKAFNIPDPPSASFGPGTVIQKTALEMNYERAHSDLRKGLRKIVSRKMPGSWVAALASSAAQMFLIPDREIERRQLSVSYRYITYSLWSGLAYALLLLLDDSRSYSARLCQCRLKSCGHFFLAHRPRAGTGRWIRAYHARECFDMAQKEKTAERVRRFREAKRTRRKLGGARLQGT